MASTVRIRTRSLPALAVWWIISFLAQSVDGGRLFRVGGDYGWNFTRTSDGSINFNYQAWASSQKLSVDDALDFGDRSLLQNDVMLVTWEAETTCDVSNGKLISPNAANIVLYNFTSSGQFSFVSPVEAYCASGMKFTVTVSDRQSGLLSSPPQGSEPHGGKKSSTCSPCASRMLLGWVVGLGTGALLALLVILTFMWRRRRLLQRSAKGIDFLSGSHAHSLDTKDLEAGAAGVVRQPVGRPQSFPYEQLKGATKNFNSSLMVGEGGFGKVYKAYIGGSRGYPVAVKRMSKDANQGTREFFAEVNIFSQLRHPNIVQLLGWCDEHDELILVYEYMPNGDLDDLIFGGYLGDQDPEFIPLAWACRYNIFCGVATALVYLHEELEQQILHRDVKTSNVMLDSEFNARLGDFGLARLSLHGQDPRTTEVAGTMGYLAPEFILTGKVTEKTDVYAFGMVVLEVSCARRPNVPHFTPLLEWVWNLHLDDTLLDAIDPKLGTRRSNSNEEGMKLALRVGLLCCHPDPPARPKMRHVLNMLTGRTPLPGMADSNPMRNLSAETVNCGVLATFIEDESRDSSSVSTQQQFSR